MLWIIAAILIVLWIIGITSSYAFGGFIHILLVAGLIIIIIRVIAGKKSF